MKETQGCLFNLPFYSMRFVKMLVFLLIKEKNKHYVFHFKIKVQGAISNITFTYSKIFTYWSGHFSYKYLKYLRLMMFRMRFDQSGGQRVIYCGQLNSTDVI